MMPTQQEISTAADVLLALAEHEDSLEGTRSILGAARRVLALRDTPSGHPPPSPPSRPTEPRRRVGKPAGRNLKGPGRAHVVAAVEAGFVTPTEVAEKLKIDQPRAAEFLRSAQKKGEIVRVAKGRYKAKSDTHPEP